MIEPLSELDEASSQLTASWKRYVSACTALNTHCTTESSLDSTSRQTLSDRMVDALASASEHYTNAEHARSIISNARNSFAPISALPSETLAHIFQLVVNSHPCEPGMRTGQNIKLPKYPDYLSYVCSYWRNVALDTPSLWTHIDIVRNHSLTSRLLERAAVCAMRASSALLDIHIYDPFIFEKQPETSIYDFLTSITPRISSFELVPQNRRELYYGHSRLLTWFFENCLPGTLTSIAVGVGVGTGITGRIFICSPENRDDLGSSRKVVGTSSKQLEPLLLPVKSLRLHSAFFPWNHPAYHGLDELRLTSEVAIRILELDLVNIFKSSPGLRVLQLGVKILPSQNTSDYPAVPVDLPFLEVLDLAATANNQLGRLARLLAPGSRPLQVYLKILDDEVPLYGDGDELLQLFSRSKITKLYIKAERRGVWHKTARAVDDTIHPFPHLQVLALEGFDWSDSPSVQPDGVLCDCVSPATGFRLESLHIIKAEAFISSFERIALRHPAKVLTIWEAQMWMAHEYSGAKLQSALSNLAPVVRVMERPPAPEEIWL